MVKPIVLPITYKSDPRGLRKAEKQLKGFATGVGKVAAGAVAAVGIIGAVSVKAFADFDSAMNQSLAIMGNVSDALRNDMSDAAREVAKTTTFSAEQAAESYFFLASAGLSAKASIEALPKVASFAQAGMFDMALATDLLTDAQSALGLTVDDTAQNTLNMVRVSDVLVKANTLANASVEQFSTALTTKAGAALKILGKDVEEGVAVLAAFADQGIKAELAGSQLGIILRDLSTKAIKFEDEFHAMGIAVFDEAGEFRNLADVIGDMEGALAGMSDETAKATLLQLGFSDRSLGSLMSLMGQSEAIRQYEKDLRKAGGTTEEVAGKQLETLNAQLGLLKDEIVDVGIELGSHLAPAFGGLVTAMKPVIKQVGAQLILSFKLLIPVIQQLFEFLPRLIGALIPLIPAMISIAALFFETAEVLLPSLVGILGVFLPMLVFLTEFLANNAEALTSIVVGITAATAVFKLWNMAVMAGQVAMFIYNATIAANPLGALIIAVMAVVAALVFFFTQTETGRKAWAVFTDFVLTTAIAIADGFMWWFGEVIPAVWASFVEFLSNGWTGFKDGFFTVLENIGNFFKFMVNGYISMWENFVNFFINGINTIISGINRLSFTIPAIGDLPSATIGFNLPTIPNLSLPRLAEGGIVKRQPGGIIANIGEGRYDEAVVPLKPGMKMGSTYNITVNAGMGSDGQRIGEQIIQEIKRYERHSGPVFARA